MFFQYRNGKLIADNVRPDNENFEFMANGEYDKVFTDWKEGDILYIGEVALNYPIEDNGKMREMTEEELVKAGIITEPVETKEQLVEQKINYILEYEKLAANKKVVESSKFSSEDEIKSITEKMVVLEGYINVLTEKIKAL